MRGKHDLNPALTGLIFLILTIGLTNDNGKQSQRSHWLFFIALASLCIYMVFFCASSDPPADYYTISPVTALFFRSLDHILLRKYQRELQPSGQKPLSKMPLKERLWWATSLAGNTRGIGWTHEPTLHIPTRPSSTRGKFVLSQLMWLVIYFLQFDICNIFIRKNPCFATGGPSLTAFGWLWRLTAWLHVSSAYILMSMLYIAYSIISVAIGISEPRDWPHLFGSPLDGYTVRNCWGRVWHQMLRKLVTGHADFISKLLRLQRSTFTTCFKLYIAFSVSGLIHHAAEYILYQKWGGRSMEFFLLQATAIIFENVVITLAARVGFSSKPNRFFKFIGFLWVLTWFAYTLPLWLDNQIHAGLMDKRFNFSLILGLRSGDWTLSR
ncbi:hypothetical protein BYT27DRAFT_7175008 [Phlegmacium glaucopus]|nr:hypothetical protein BYT27DRAFT_7175008 [Phlegmacium glaucopus]